MRITEVFKGGPVSLHSGGYGPDDYLIKPIQGGRWHLVKFGFGRNYRRDGPDPLHEKDMMGGIMKRTCQVCIPDIRDVIEQRGGLEKFPVVNGSEFAKKYSDLIDEI